MTAEVIPITAARRRRPGRRRRGRDPWRDLRWDQHEEARRLVEEHPDGMSLEQIGEAMGVNRRCAHYYLQSALDKLRHGADSALLRDYYEHTFERYTATNYERF